MGVCCTPPQLECHENETRIRENETRMPRKRNPNTRKRIRERKKTYPNTRKRNSNAFDNEKNNIRIREHQYSNTRKPIFECVFGFWFIYFGPNVMDVGHTPCGISVHPRLDSGWSDMASGCAKQQYGWIGLLPRLHVTTFDRCYGMFVGLHPHNIKQLTHD